MNMDQEYRYSEGAVNMAKVTQNIASHNVPVATLRRPASQVIMEQAMNLANSMEKTAMRVSETLTPVMRMAGPETPSNKAPVPQEAYPPLFEEIRMSLNRIERHMATINECIDLTEL